MTLDSKLSYENSFQSIFSRVNIVFLRKRQPALPRKSLVAIYRSFIKSHLDYGNGVYDRASNEPFHQSLESLQHGAAVAITEVIRGASSEKVLHELGLETLKSRRQSRKSWLFYKLIKEKSPVYLFQLISENNTPYTTRSVQRSEKRQTFSKILSFLQ